MYNELFAIPKTVSKNNLLSVIAQILFCFTLLFITGKMIVPFKPIPFIMYDLSILFICINFGSRVTFLAIFSYLSLRIFEYDLFPMFTVGFMIGMLANSLLINWLKIYIKDNKLLYIIGLCCIFLFGVSWLAYFVGLGIAIKTCFLPFIFPSIIKFLLFILMQNFFVSNK